MEGGTSPTTSNGHPHSTPSVAQLSKANFSKKVIASFTHRIYNPIDVRRRMRTNEFQQKALEELFEENSSPDNKRKKELAAKIDMTLKQVQVWFQNKRAKKRAKEKDIDRQRLAHGGISPSDQGAGPRHFTTADLPPPIAVSGIRDIPSSYASTAETQASTSSPKKILPPLSLPSDSSRYAPPPSLNSPTSAPADTRHHTEMLPPPPPVGWIQRHSSMTVLPHPLGPRFSIPAVQPRYRAPFLPPSDIDQNTMFSRHQSLPGGNHIRGIHPYNPAGTSVVGATGGLRHLTHRHSSGLLRLNPRFRNQTAPYPVLSTPIPPPSMLSPISPHFEESFSFHPPGSSSQSSLSSVSYPSPLSRPNHEDFQGKPFVPLDLTGHGPSLSCPDSPVPMPAPLLEDVRGVDEYNGQSSNHPRTTDSDLPYSFPPRETRTPHGPLPSPAYSFGQTYRTKHAPSLSLSATSSVRSTYSETPKDVESESPVSYGLEFSSAYSGYPYFRLGSLASVASTEEFSVLDNVSEYSEQSKDYEPAYAPPPGPPPGADDLAHGVYVPRRESSPAPQMFPPRFQPDARRASCPATILNELAQLHTPNTDVATGLFSHLASDAPSTLEQPVWSEQDGEPLLAHHPPMEGFETRPHHTYQYSHNKTLSAPVIPPVTEEPSSSTSEARESFALPSSMDDFSNYSTPFSSNADNTPLPSHGDDFSNYSTPFSSNVGSSNSMTPFSPAAIPYRRMSYSHLQVISPMSAATVEGYSPDNLGDSPDSMASENSPYPTRYDPPSFVPAPSRFPSSMFQSMASSSLAGALGPVGGGS